MWVRSDVVPTRVASLPVRDFFFLFLFLTVIWLPGSNQFFFYFMHGVRHFLAVFREKIKLVVV